MNCLFCQSSDIKPVAFPRPTTFNGKLFSYKGCRDCGLVFIDPLPGPQDYAELYKSDYHDEFYFDAREIRNDGIVDIVRRFKKNGKILDYGCGDGWLLKSFVEKGFMGYGVEYDAVLVEKLRSRYPSMKFETIPNVGRFAKEGIDTVHMGDVLEHLANPVEVIRNLRNLLEATDGLLVVQGPLENNKHLGLAVRKLVSGIQGGKVSDHKPYHITFSNARNQLGFFEKWGFETIFYEVSETAWPYPESPKGSIGTAAKYGIAKVSKALSSVLPGKMGNRFVYIGKVRS